MRNLVLGQVLGSVFANAARRRGGLGAGMGLPAGGALGGMGGLPGGLGGAAIGSVLAGMMGRRRGLGGGRGALLAMLLPVALQWVQRNGGIGAVLKRVHDRGYGRQASSWVSTSDNEVIDADAVEGVIGRDELDRVSRELGVSEAEVKEGFAEILPEMVDQITPSGRLHPQADDVLQDSIPLMQQELEHARRESSEAV
jgi:uncharacterized protein YidB (DUF937 family)